MSAQPLDSCAGRELANTGSDTNYEQCAQECMQGVTVPNCDAFKIGGDGSDDLCWLFIESNCTALEPHEDDFVNGLNYVWTLKRLYFVF